MTTEKILGVKLNFGLKMTDVLNIIENDFLENGKSNLICTTNPEFIMDAQKDNKFREIINESSLSIPDGIGIVMSWAYLKKISGKTKNLLFPFYSFCQGLGVGISSFFNDISSQSLKGVVLAEEICKLSSEKNYSIFFLGGWPKNWLGKKIETTADIASLAADNMKKKYPGANIIGATSEFSSLETDDVATLDYIKLCMSKNNVKTLDFIFVAYNHCKQEKWINRNISKIPAKVGIGVGGTFDYMSGHYKTVPKIFSKFNLEWLYKFFTQPFRIKRIMRAFPLFPLKVYINSLKK